MSLSGTVKFFDTGKGFGFITQNNGGPDCFVHGSQVSGKGLNEGDQVQYEVETGEDGRSKACNVSGGTRDENDFSNNRGGNRGFGNEGNYGGNSGGNSGVIGGNSGTVKFFDTGKGFGFITQNNGGPDCFVHGSNVSGKGLNEGDQVQYEVEIAEDGRSRAVNVSGGTRDENSFNNNRGGNRGYGNEGGYGGNSGGYGGNSGGFN